MNYLMRFCFTNELHMHPKGLNSWLSLSYL